MDKLRKGDTRRQREKPKMIGEKTLNVEILTQTLEPDLKGDLEKKLKIFLQYSQQIYEISKHQDRGLFDEEKKALDNIEKAIIKEFCERFYENNFEKILELLINIFSIDKPSFIENIDGFCILRRIFDTIKEKNSRLYNLFMSFLKKSGKLLFLIGPGEIEEVILGKCILDGKMKIMALVFSYFGHSIYFEKPEDIIEIFDNFLKKHPRQIEE